MSTDGKRRVLDPIIVRIRAEIGRFFSDPIGYAIDRWIGAFILVIALWILYGAARMLITAVLAMLATP
jgi:hypothetical protein